MEDDLDVDVRREVGDDLREGLTAVISVQLPQPEFEGQTKTKLGTGEVRGLVESILYKELSRILEESPKIARPIIDKVVDKSAQAIDHLASTLTGRAVEPQEKSFLKKLLGK